MAPPVDVLGEVEGPGIAGGTKLNGEIAGGTKLNGEIAGVDDIDVFVLEFEGKFTKFIGTRAEEVDAPDGLGAILV